MSKRGQYALAACVGVIVLLAGALFLRAQKSAAAPEAVGGGTIYYTGPMQSKGHPGTWADSEGNIVAPPPQPAKPRPPKAEDDVNPGTVPTNKPPSPTGKP